MWRNVKLLHMRRISDVSTYRNLKFLHMADFFSTNIFVGIVTNMRYALSPQRLRCSLLFNGRLNLNISLFRRLILALGVHFIILYTAFRLEDYTVCFIKKIIFSYTAFQLEDHTVFWQSQFELSLFLSPLSPNLN